MKALRLGIFLFSIIFLVLLSWVFLDSSKEKEVISPLAKIINNIPIVSGKSRLEKIVSASMEGAKGDYAIYIKNLKTGETYSQRENEVFDSASLYKLWVMGQVYRYIELGALDKDEVLTQDIKVLNEKFDISSDSAELKEGEISLTISEALNQMITISHNYAALLLAEKIKLSSIANFLKRDGFTHSSIGADGSAPKTTAHDIALFFEKVYKGEIIDKNYSSQMIELLKRQKLNNKIPRDLPEDVVVAHKTGELGYFTHDGGIVYGPKAEYIIVVLSKSNYPPGAVDRIAALSKAVYDYFNR